MIVVFGSINVDLITPVLQLPARGETVLGRDYAVVQGGKGANQALAAACGAAAGRRVAMVGTIGSDPWGPFALERLRAAGVDLSCVGTGTAADGLRVHLRGPSRSDADHRVARREYGDASRTP